MSSTIQLVCLAITVCLYSCVSHSPLRANKYNPGQNEMPKVKIESVKQKNSGIVINWSFQTDSIKTN